MNRPFGLSFELSNACNLRCGFCTRRAGFVGEKMPLDTFARVLEDLSESGLHIHTIRLDGDGEALTYGDGIVDAVRLAASLAHTVFFITNGVLLTPELSEQLILAGMNQILVSVTGVDPLVYAKFQGSGLEPEAVERQLQRVLANLGNFIKTRDRLHRDVHVQAQYLLTPHSEPHFFSFARQIRALGVDEIGIAALVDEETPDRTYVQQVFDERVRKRRSLCVLAQGTVTVTAGGDVYPCCAPIRQYTELCLGNIHQRPLSAILRDERLERLLTALQTGDAAHIPEVCRTCPFPAVRDQ